MNHELTIAVLAGLGGMLGWGLADFFAKKTIDVLGDIRSLVWAHIFGTACFIILAWYRFEVNGVGVVLPRQPAIWLGLAFFGVLQAVVYLLVYRGFGKGQVAILNPVFASFSGLTAILSIIIFGEVVTKSLIVALIILFTGVILMSLDLEALKKWRINFSHVPGLREVALATILASFWTLFWDQLVGGQDWLSFALYMYAFMTIAILILARVKRVPLAVGTKGLWKFLFLIGLCETVAYAAISLGYSLTTKTSVVALLSGAFSLPTIILARLFLKERITRTQTIASIIIIVGIILVSLV